MFTNFNFNLNFCYHTSTCGAGTFLVSGFHGILHYTLRSTLLLGFDYTILLWLKRILDTLDVFPVPNVGHTLAFMHEIPSDQIPSPRILNYAIAYSAQQGDKEKPGPWAN